MHAAIAPLADATVRDALSGLSAAEQSLLVTLMSTVKVQLTAMAAHDPRVDLSELEKVGDAEGVEIEQAARAILP